jgi:hypothetical protein
MPDIPKAPRPVIEDGLRTKVPALKSVQEEQGAREAVMAKLDKMLVDEFHKKEAIKLRANPEEIYREPTVMMVPSKEMRDTGHWCSPSTKFVEVDLSTCRKLQMEAIVGLEERIIGLRWEVNELQAKKAELDAQWMANEKALVAKLQELKLCDGRLTSMFAGDEKLKVATPEELGVLRGGLKQVCRLCTKMERTISNGSYKCIFVDVPQRHALLRAWAADRLVSKKPRFINLATAGTYHGELGTTAGAAGRVLPLPRVAGERRIVTGVVGRVDAGNIQKSNTKVEIAVGVSVQTGAKVRWHKTGGVGAGGIVMAEDDPGASSAPVGYGTTGATASTDKDEGVASIEWGDFRRENEGEYTVVTQNNFGTAVADPISVVLPEPPTFMDMPPPIMEGALYDEMVLRAVALGTPPIDYTWYRNDQPMASKSSLLKFNSLAEIDFAEYKCVARNAGGKATTPDISIVFSEQDDDPDRPPWEKKEAVMNKGEIIMAREKANTGRYLNPIWKQVDYGL